MLAITNDLPAELMERLTGLTATHTAPDQRPDSSTTHPVIGRDPGLGRRLLYVNPLFTVGIDGMDPDESQDLLSELYSYLDRPEYQCRLHWKVDTVAIWDCPTIQRYDCSDYWPQTRITERTLLAADPPDD